MTSVLEHAGVVRLTIAEKIESLVRKLILFKEDRRKELMTGNIIYIDQTAGVERAIDLHTSHLQNIAQFSRNDSLTLKKQRDKKKPPRDTPIIGHSQNIELNNVPSLLLNHLQEAQKLEKEILILTTGKEQQSQALESLKSDYIEGFKSHQISFTNYRENVIEKIKQLEEKIVQDTQRAKNKIPNVGRWDFPEGSEMLHSYVKTCEFIKGCLPDLMRKINQLAN